VADDRRSLKTMKTHPLLIIALFGAILHPLSASTTIDWIGSYSSDSSPWKVSIHEDKPPQFGYDRKDGIGTGISPSAWRPHKGWFVFIENDSRLWAYDGVDSLLLAEVSPDKGALYDLSSLAIMPPSEVLKRLPESFRRQVISKVKKIEQSGPANAAARRG